jgi:glycosyltransferase involved in cell wall biosynthesis
LTTPSVIGVPALSSTASRSADATLDVIVPVFDEAQVIELPLARLSEALSSGALAAHGARRARLIFVDDGSTDATAAVLAARIAASLDALLVRLTRSFGHQNALSAGLDHADAEAVVVMDADLQDPPELLLPMLERWRRGSDVVFARHRRRLGHRLKRLGYWAFYRLVGFLSEIKLPLDSGDFSLLDRRVVAALGALPERLRFPRGLRAWVGFRREAFEFDRPEREAGQTTYPWRRLYRLATDGIASMSTRPLQAAQLASFFFGLLTFAFPVMLISDDLFSSTSSIPAPLLVA